MAGPVTFIGFGEAAQAFAGAGDWKGDAWAYDVLTDDPATRPAKEADYARCRARGFDHAGAALAGARLVLSLVTADQALDAARRAAGYLKNGPLFCDMNSVAPETKRTAAETIELAGGRYVDVAIMSPVRPLGLHAPLLLSGPAAPAAKEALRSVGFSNLRVVGARVGEASAIKMIRSVIIKGIEALTAEAMLAADAAGVADEVLASLDSSDAPTTWRQRADYNLDRMIAHGLRRAREMEEVAKTLEAFGVEPLMTRATVARQHQLGALRLSAPAAGLAAKMNQISDRKADAA
jgi:3-hydroxyisobutyrate dehydrogenase-like beta-hydroxyacid dehydrogenase